MKGADIFLRKAELLGAGRNGKWPMCWSKSVIQKRLCMFLFY
jgi:hypothetical protein